MKNDSLNLIHPTTDFEYRKLIEKYDTVFTGEKMNKVTSVEVASFLKMDHDKMLTMLRKVTPKLEMNLEGLHAIESSVSNSIDVYYITLY